MHAAPFRRLVKERRGLSAMRTREARTVARFRALVKVSRDIEGEGASSDTPEHSLLTITCNRENT